MLAARDVEVLLYDLCVKLGACVPPADFERLCAEPPEDPRAFIDAVFLAEGLDPATMDRGVYRQALAFVTDAFRRKTEALEQQRMVGDHDE